MHRSDDEAPSLHPPPGSFRPARPFWHRPLSPRPPRAPGRRRAWVISTTKHAAALPLLRGRGWPRVSPCARARARRLGRSLAVRRRARARERLSACTPRARRRREALRSEATRLASLFLNHPPITTTIIMAHPSAVCLADPLFGSSPLPPPPPHTTVSPLPRPPLFDDTMSGKAPFCPPAALSMRSCPKTPCCHHSNPSFGPQQQ